MKTIYKWFENKTFPIVYTWFCFFVVVCHILFSAQYLNIGLFRDSIVMCIHVGFCLHNVSQKVVGIPLPSLAVCGRINSVAPCSDSQARVSDFLSLNQVTPRLPFNQLFL